ncbi:MAG: N-6 DNA methylase [Candidatus Magasanikbacteria bacterium]|nr:N-6 DNA methylase [Candidatus Magasanikbacteria bacterium]
MATKLPTATQNPVKNKWLFILGRETTLSFAEIQALFLLNNIEHEILHNQENKLIFTAAHLPDAGDLIKKLGGTIKIAYSIGKIKNPNQLAKFLNEHITDGKIEFSINGSMSLGIETKKILKQMGRSARYVEAKNSATVIYNNLIKSGADIEIYQDELFMTAAIQPIEDFSKRDFGRPGRDDESGMLPPKLAMMMINLATVKTDKTIFDPSCGSGTVISEAVLMGYKKIIAVDISDKAINDTILNLQWLKTNFQVKNNTDDIKIFVGDVTKISQKIKSDSVDAIITEPYLGKPLRGSESSLVLEQQADELKRLYLESFAQFHKILKDDGVAVFIIPRFKTSEGWITIDCEEEIEDLGFKNDCILPEEKHLTYWRETQHVGREIWRFKKV